MIDVVRDVECEQPNNNSSADIITIKLKNSVLKDLIVKSRNESKTSNEAFPHSKPHPPAAMAQQNWYSEFKKAIGDNDLHLQNEVIH